jgi:hypothetical protein
MQYGLLHQFVSGWCDKTGIAKSKKTTSGVAFPILKNNLTTEDCCPPGSDTMKLDR